MNGMEKPIAYVDYLEVCTRGLCGQPRLRCEPNVRIVGHCDDGGDVAFLLVVRDEKGRVVAHTLDSSIMGGIYRDGLLAQEGDGYLITSNRNPGPPWLSCEFAIHTGGAGGYMLSQFLARSVWSPPDVRYKVEVFASPVEWECMPDGQLLRRRCLGEWNWEGGQEVELHMYQHGRAIKCDQAQAGEVPEYWKPAIEDLVVVVWDDEGKEGYARVTVEFSTDMPAESQVHFALVMEGGKPGEDIGPACDPFSMWRSRVSGLGVRHSVELPPGALWYSSESPKDYCLQVVAWLPRYRWVHWARAHSDVVNFILPSE